MGTAEPTNSLLTPRSLSLSTPRSKSTPIPLLAKANLKKLSIPGKHKNNSIEYIVNNGNKNITPPMINRDNRDSPLSLVFSTTSTINLIGSECVTPTSNHWGDTSESDQEEEESDHEQENWNQIDCKELKENYEYDEDESYWKQKHKEFNIKKSYLNIRPSLSGSTRSNSNISNISNSPNSSYPPFLPKKLSVSSTTSNTSIISDICLEFPFCTKMEELNFDLSQKNHNSKIQNVDIAKTRQIGQDLFHKYHIIAWQKKYKKENIKKKQKHKKRNSIVSNKSNTKKLKK